MLSAVSLAVQVKCGDEGGGWRIKKTSVSTGMLRVKIHVCVGAGGILSAPTLCLSVSDKTILPCSHLDIDFVFLCPLISIYCHSDQINYNHTGCSLIKTQCTVEHEVRFQVDEQTFFLQ